MEVQNLSKPSLFHFIYNDETNRTQDTYQDINEFIDLLTSRGMVKGEICINNNYCQILEKIFERIFPFHDYIDEMEPILLNEYLRLPQMYNYQEYSSVFIFVWSQMNFNYNSIACNDHPCYNLDINISFVIPNLFNKYLNDIPVILLFDCARPSSYYKSYHVEILNPIIPEFIKKLFIGYVITTEGRRESENLNFFKIIFENLNSKISFQDNFKNCKKKFQKMNLDVSVVENFKDDSFFINLTD